jgi:hypothetical protein
MIYFDGQGPRLLAGIAIVFGIATLVAGARVLAGGDPGYVVYRPLVIFNTLMGVAYLAAAALMWRGTVSGRNAAAVIFALNLAMLGVVVYLFRSGAAIAVESVRAMVFRSGVWLALFLALAWLSRDRRTT